MTRSWWKQTAVLCGVAWIAAVQAEAGQTAASTTRAPVAPSAVAQFAGMWDYNDEQSVNAATGRPERSPRSATQRGGGARGPLSGAGVGWGRGPSGPFGLSSSQDMRDEVRTFTRDLLEIPESFTIEVTSDAVTFTDDLQRARTYPTDGNRRRYQLGAARFDARVRWDGAQLKKEITGEYGYRLFETYFVSDDGRQLFVIIRAGTPGRDAPVIGADRVYDRVTR